MIEGLKIIGESINDSVPSTRELFDIGNLEGIQALAKRQDEKGADYIDVNVGRREPEFMAGVVRKIQEVTAKPLSIDTPDPRIAAAGLAAYDRQHAGGLPPILNSITQLRLDMLDLHAAHSFMPILLASERTESGKGVPNQTAQETYETARALMAEVRRRLGLPNSHCIIDPGIGPIASDSEGMLRRVLDAMALIHGDPDLNGVHMSVGLSNFTVMLPSKRTDGLAVRATLDSAFLTLAKPLGLDMIIGSTQRKYALLSPGHPALVCLQDILNGESVDAILRVIEFYQST